ncbi:TPR-like protein [Cyathus striatus]|nr:TPR-like protein [Cyathus striatus]
MNDLANSLRAKFLAVGDMKDLERALELHATAVEMKQDGHPDLPVLLGGFKESIMVKFSRSGDIADVDEAISVIERSIALTPEGDSSMSTRLNNLGNALLARAQLSTELEDIVAAISMHEKAIELEKDESFIPGYLNNLGSSFQRRFDCIGELKDIEQAIAVRQRSIHLVKDNHNHVPIWLSNLGYSLSCRYKITGEEQDIKEAIDVQKRSVLGMTPELERYRPAVLMNLSTSYLLLADTGDLSALVDGVSTLEVAIKATPENHIYLPMELHNYGSSLLDMFGYTKDVKRLDMAIEVRRRAVSLGGKGSAMLPEWLSGLAIAIERRYEATGDVRDADESLEIRRRVIQLAPEGHTDMPAWISNLALSLSARYEQFKEWSYLEEAISLYRRAATISTGPATVRITAARRWAQLCSDSEHKKAEALEAYKVAFALLPEVVWLGFDMRTRHRQVKELSSLSQAAAATAISFGEYKTALEWLEQGRGVVWNQLTDLRAPVEALRECDAELADEFMRVSWMLERASSGNSAVPELETFGEKLSMQEQVIQHRELASQWHALLKRVRQLPGLEHFMQPVKFAELRSAAKNGPVVVINVHASRCDALALVDGRDDVVHIPLAQFSYEKAEQLLTMLNNYLSSGKVEYRLPRVGRPSTSSNGNLGYILAELWTCVMRPVLLALSIVPCPENASRIWLCPVGALAFLPLHAAGIYGSHNRSFGSVASDFVISSYLPTITSMVKKRIEPLRTAKILLVSQENAPGLPSLPGTTEECEQLQQLFRAQGRGWSWLQEEAANVASVSDAMDECSWIHLACHASQNINEPTKSALYLSDGALDLGAISQKSHSHAELAFLSACQTSTGDKELSEEAVHLAAGMFTAGYRSVIATMWPIDDAYAPKVAMDVYSHLLGDARTESSCRSAEALHQAAKRLREELGDSESSYMAWVPYVHIGY